MPQHRYDDFLAWTVFWKTVKTGNLTKAAIGLDMDPAVASRLLKSLEESVGEPLLDRKKRPLRTTYRGEQLFDQVGSLVTEFQRFVVRNFKGSVYRNSPYNTTTRVSSSQGYAHAFLAPLLAEYLRLDANAGFCLYIEKSLSELAAKKVDILVTGTENTREEFVKYDVRAIPCVALCSPAYIREHGEPRTPADLVRHTVLTRTGNNFPPSRRTLYRGSERVEATYGREFFSDSSVMIRESAVQGTGIVFDLPAEYLGEQIEKGELVQVLKGWHRKPFFRAVQIRKSDWEEGGFIRKFAEWLAGREREESLRRELLTFMKLGVSARDYV